MFRMKPECVQDGEQDQTETSDDSARHGRDGSPSLPGRIVEVVHAMVIATEVNDYKGSYKGQSSQYAAYEEQWFELEGCYIGYEPAKLH